MSQKTFTRRVVTKYRTPDEALDLNENICALGRILNELRYIDSRNVHADPVKGRQMLRFVTGQVKMAERHAREKMQDLFLVPIKRMNAR